MNVLICLFTVLLGKFKQTYGSVVKSSCCAYGDMGSIPPGHWTSLQPLSHFAWLWGWLNLSVDWHKHIYIATSSLIFSPLKLCQWLSCSDKVLTCNMNMKSPKNACQFAILLGYLVLGWILTSRFMLHRQFLERKYLLSVWAAKYFCQEVRY